MDCIDTFVFRSTLCSTLFLLGFPFDCLFILLFLSDVLFVAKNVTYLRMMDWSSPSQLPLEHVVLFILFWGFGVSSSDDGIDHVTSVTHSNSVFDYSAEPLGL